MAYRIIGNTLVEWDDAQPITFTLSETAGPDVDRREKDVAIDLTSLRVGFEEDFLLHLKDHLIQRRSKVSLRSIKTESICLISVFRKIIDLKLFDLKVKFIDETFLLSLGAVKDDVTDRSLSYLKMAFIANPYSQMFATGLHASDFPLKVNKKGHHGLQIDRILAKALTRTACVHILTRCEQAYEMGEMDIGRFSFVNLAFAVFCRPESYRQIRIGDLVFDEESNAFFIYIIPVKTGVHLPEKLCYQINEPLGRLLQKQRQHVVASYAHLVTSAGDISKLALFPARKLKVDKSGWISHSANQNFGVLHTAGSFMNAYPVAINNLLQDARFTVHSNALRHTIGTQLAQTGASAKTIQAVLKHASDTVCNAYVDIAFQGLINELSDAMQPAFQSQLPAVDRFRSKNDSIPVSKAIRSDDLKTGHIELTGECGKQIQCQHAPIVCYGCRRFIPCWDADHSVNLNTVQREIDDYKQKGKPFQHMVQRAQESKYQIIGVMNATDRYRQAMVQEARL